MKKKRPWFFLSFLGFLAVLFLAGKAGYSGQITPTLPGFAPNHNGTISKELVEIKDAQAIGNDACYNCHPQQGVDYGVSKDDWRMNLHSKLPGTMDCEACHGNASLHSQANNSTLINQPAKMSIEFQRELCQSCHLQGMTSIHAGGHLGCLDCHSFHAVNNAKFLKKYPEREICFKCHTAQRGEFAMYTHHPVSEGVMSCSDCHVPHFESRQDNLKESSTIFGNRRSIEACGACHPQQAGPYVTSHSYQVGCLGCHKPHGSAIEKMLRLPEPGLCYRCHPLNAVMMVTHTGRCTTCHFEVHGTNASRSFFF